MEHYQPRTRRTRDALWFGSIVCIDCTALDIVLHREDRSEYTARVIAFQDLATNTLFFHLVFPRQGEGVTQSHVAEAFIAWCERYGVPASVLVDNGPEFRRLHIIDDLMKLSARLGVEKFSILQSGDRPDLAKLVAAQLASAQSAVRHARPYNPQSKPIEGQFSNITRWFLPIIQGWIGGNRTRQPTQRQGKRAEHFSGSSFDLVRAIDEALAFYDLQPQSGHLKGLSPAGRRAADVSAGYQRVDVNVEELREYWSRQYTCSVRQGEIRVPKLGRYSHPNLGALIVGTRVTIRVPLVGDQSRIAVFLENDELLCFAEPVTVHHFLDPDGAQNQRNRAAAQGAVLASMEAETRPFDPVEVRRQFVSMHAPSPGLPSVGVIQVDRHARKAAAERRLLPRVTSDQLPSSQDFWADLELPPTSEPHDNTQTPAVTYATSRRRGTK